MAESQVQEYKCMRLAWELRGVHGSLRAADGGSGRDRGGLLPGLSKDDLWVLLQEGVRHPKSHSPNPAPSLLLSSLELSDTQVHEP